MATRHRFLIGEEEHTVTVEEHDQTVVVRVDDGDPLEIDVTTSGVPGQFSMIVDGRPRRAFVARRGPGFEVTVDGRRFGLHPAGAGGRGRSAAGGASDPPGKVTAPLAGVVVEVRVAVGDVFEAGQTLFVVEAMKMQNEVGARLGGTVTRIVVAQGARAEAGDVVIEYDPAAE